ncbi:MAG: DUF370 domain-containing protein [Bacillales bacterium]|nr:DUF370 domain-containing protein [Bacillales bacterium]
MYLHVGEDCIIHAKDIVVILDRKGSDIPDLLRYWKRMGKFPKLPVLRPDCKSIVITTEQIYFSPFASSTLKKHLARINGHSFSNL